jgi:hypothetical protein
VSGVESQVVLTAVVTDVAAGWSSVAFRTRRIRLLQRNCNDDSG